MMVKRAQAMMTADRMMVSCMHSTTASATAKKSPDHRSASSTSIDKFQLAHYSALTCTTSVFL